MSKALEPLAKRLKAATEGRGRKAEFCRAIGMSASQVDGYIAGRNQPNLAVLERLAEHWGVQPWELIRPAGAQATPARAPALSQLLSPAGLRLLDLISAMDEAQLISAVRSLEHQLSPASVTELLDLGSDEDQGQQGGKPLKRR